MIKLPIQGVRGGYGCLLTQGAAIGLKSIAFQGVGCRLRLACNTEQINNVKYYAQKT